MAEPTKPDLFLQRMKAIRDHRLHKAEAELALGRQRCADSRQAMREARARVFEAQAQAEAHWQQALRDFQGMAINAKQFVACKCRHQTLKLKAAALRAQARAAVVQAQEDRRALRQARHALQDQQLQVEKLRLLREIQQAVVEEAVAF